MWITAGSTNVSAYVYFVDDVSGTATGEATTGLLFSDIETGGSASYCRQGAIRTDFTLQTLASASAAHADGGFILVDDTNMPGLYRVDLPDAALVAGADFVTIHMVAAGAKNTLMRPLLIMLPDVDLGDTVRAGLTALPNAAANAAGGLAISTAGALDIDATDANVSSILTDTGTTLPGLLPTALVGGKMASAVHANYDDGAIWIDTTASNTNTTDYVDGVATNPVSTIAAANTIATSTGLNRFRVAPGSTITFGAAQNGQVFIGEAWTLALGGQQIVGSSFEGATVSGVAAGTGTTQIYTRCLMGATSHIKGTHLLECGITGTQTIVEAGDFFVDRCHSGVAGSSTPIWDFGGALNSSDLNFRNYSGGIEVANMGAGSGSYNMSLEGRGQVILAASCSATSNLSIRGPFSVTDNAGGAVTVTEDARFNTTNTVNSNMVSISGDATAADNLEESTTGIIATSVNDGSATTTAFVIAYTEATDDHFNGRIITFTSGALKGQSTDITDYTGSSNTVTVTALTEAPANGVFFVIT